MGETMGDEGTPPVSTEAEGTPQHVTDSTTTAGSESTAGEAAGGPGDEDTNESRSKVGAAAAVTAAAVAGVAGGIAVAARDSRRRILGKPIGKRSRAQHSAAAVVNVAGTVVDKALEPAKRLSSRFRDLKTGPRAIRASAGKR
jgi:hypothetical protein